MYRKYLIALISLLLVSTVTQGAITAPTSGGAGKLIVVRSDVPATWLVFPETYKTSYYVSDDGCTLIFASPKAGVVNFIAASVEDGKSVIKSHTLYNGVDAPDSMDGDTESDDTTPTIESVIKSGSNGKDAKELSALADSFESAIDGIDRGTITTVSGARETFRSAWVRNAASVNPQAINNLSSLIADISEMIDNTSMATVKADYTRAVQALRSVKPATTPQAQTPPPTNNSSPCANGQCNRYWYYK